MQTRRFPNAHTIAAAALLLAAGAVLTNWKPVSRAAEKKHLAQSVSLRKMADSLHAVIAADREIYAKEIVERLARREGVLAADAAWREKHCLPVPAQMLRMANIHIQRRGGEFSYVLRSPWPINPAQSPQTETEEQALKAVLADPDKPHYFEEELGGRSYFLAAYADRATQPSCVECHNQRSRSPRRDFKLGDVMGAVIVRIPLEF
ncbi:MAG: DUF3365 domain-containing protein [Verrucomicrobia bacterium]|nr:DUF3365 domain-containing protein [Verrucomicrobiota bacterium]